MNVRRPWSSVASDGGALDVDVWDEAVEGAGQVPGAVSEEAHECRDECHPDEEGVDEDARGERGSDRLVRTEPDELTRLRHRLLLSDPHLRAGQRARLQAIEDLIAASIADETDLPSDAVAPHALAAAIVTTLIAMQERFAAGRRGSPEDFARTDRMLHAALQALHPQPNA